MPFDDTTTNDNRPEGYEFYDTLDDDYYDGPEDYAYYKSLALDEDYYKTLKDDKFYETLDDNTLDMDYEYYKAHDDYECYDTPGDHYYNIPEDDTLRDDHYYTLEDDTFRDDDEDNAIVIFLRRSIARLVRLKKKSLAEYGVHLSEVLKYIKENKIAITKADLVNEVEKRVRSHAHQEHTKDGNGGGGNITFPESFPCKDQVDGVALVTALQEIIDRHVIFVKPDSSLVIALWCVATFVFDEWRIFPRLLVTASDPECGKTTLMEVIELLVNRALKSESITPAAVFRMVEQYRPTLLIDEADVCVAYNKEMRGIIDSGFQKGGKSVRTAPDGNGDFILKQFSTFSPMVLAAIGTLHPTVMTRSIKIPMARKTRDEKVTRLSGDTREFDQLRRQIARWCLDNKDKLATSQNQLPDDIINRAGDNWLPLVAIADAVSDSRGREIRQIARDWESEKTETSHGVMLLSDIRDLFLEKKSNALGTTYILERLNDMHNRPWPEYGKDGTEVTAYRYHKLLHPYKIKTNKAVRLDDGTVEKGFKRTEFEDVFNRYLPPVTIIDDDVWGGLDGTE